MKLFTAALFGSVFMFLGVALGALGSHALEGKITQGLFTKLYDFDSLYAFSRACFIVSKCIALC